MIRRILLVLLGLILIGGAAYIASSFIKNRQLPAPRERKVVTSVFTQTVENQDVPITISTNGTLQAKYRMQLFSEVQGVFDHSDGEFKPGEAYKKGSVLMEINSAEHRASLRSQKSNLFNQIVLLLPDLRLDFPEAFPGWEKYVNEFDLEARVKSLPEPQSEKEKLFIMGRNIQSAYYSVKNLEERLDKYVIKAPYYGVLIEALVTPGSLIRSGQQLGTFINPTTYELEVPVNVSYADMLRVGHKVNLHNLERTKNYKGSIIRINKIVDQATQTVQVFILVQANDLREGMYLEADLEAREEQNAYEIDRKLLVNQNEVYYVRDSTLEVARVDPVHYKEGTVVIKGLEDGTRILARPVPGAYQGMLVQVLDEISQAD